MAGMDPGALDRYITGNYGEDQYPDDHECSRCGGPWGEDETCEECTDDDGNPREVEDPTDYDSMPGGWDYEDDPQAEYDDYWGDPLDVPSYGD